MKSFDNFQNFDYFVWKNGKNCAFSILRPKISKLEKVIKILFPTDFSKLGKVILGQFLWLYDNFCMSYSKFSTKKCYVFYNIGFPIHFEIQLNFKRSYLETGLIFFDSVKSSWSFKGGRVNLDQKIKNLFFLPWPSPTPLMAVILNDWRPYLWE